MNPPSSPRFLPTAGRGCTTWCGILSLLIGLLALSPQPALAQTEAAVPESVTRAAEVMTHIQKTFYDNKSNLYNRSTRKAEPDYLWGCGVMFSALVAGSRHDSAWRPAMRRYFSALDGYWDAKAKPPGYEPAPTRGNGHDKYYDDNVWMVLTFLEAHEVTGEARYLKRAEETLQFVLSGWDEAAGGGIWWHEQHKDDAKNTCVNAPAALSCFRMAKFLLKTADERMAMGRKIVDWTNEKLRAPNGLYADRITVATGQVHEGQLTYNAALMLRAYLSLHARTGEAQYLDEAKKIGAAADSLLDHRTGAYRDAIKWAHLMVEADLELYRWTHDETYLQRVRANGTHHYAEWKQNPPHDLLANASLARELWLIADHETDVGQAFWKKSDAVNK